jgi:hypothetical protein
MRPASRALSAHLYASQQVLPVLHQDLAHLSWARIENSNVRVDHRRIADDVITVMEAFVEKLEENTSLHAEWFRTALDVDRRALGPLPPDRHVYSTSGAYDGAVVLRAWELNEGSSL